MPCFALLLLESDGNKEVERQAFERNPKRERGTISQQVKFEVKVRWYLLLVKLK